MDHSEQAQNQQQEIDDAAATQIPAAPASSYAAAPLLATGTVRAPVPVPALPSQISNPHNRLPGHPAQHFNNLEHRLQLFWESQSQQVEQTTSFKNHSVPLARIKKIMQADEDVIMIATEAPVLFAKAAEMFIMEMTLRGWAHTEEDGRRLLQTKDIAAAISGTDICDFLADVIPKYFSPTNDTIPNAAGPSSTVMYAGGQQPQPPFIGLEQAFEPWAPQPEQNNQQQNQDSSVTLAPQQQQMQQNNQQEDENEEFCSLGGSKRGN